MGWGSFGVVTFDLGPLLQGQNEDTSLKVLTSRLLVLEVWDSKQTYRKSWAKNLLM